MNSRARFIAIPFHMYHGPDLKAFALFVGLACAGCYSPRYADCEVRCGPNNRCPAELTCVYGYCSHHGATQGCGCDPASCARAHLDCSPTARACVACLPPPVPETRSEFFVDGASAVAATGSAGCPYATISDAVAAAASSSGVPAVIHVAAGTYDGTHERFPITLRRALTLDGAGPDQTIIEGFAAHDHSLDGGADVTTSALGVLAGDENGAITIANLRIASGKSPYPDTSIGLYCDRGNATADGQSEPEPNLLIKNVQIDDFSAGIMITNSFSSACNFKMISSRLTNMIWGVQSLGCRGMCQTNYPVAMQIGDGTDAGRNQFDHLLSGNDPLASSNVAVTAWDGTSRLLVEDNVFSDCDNGVALITDNQNPIYSLIEGNRLQTIGSSGVYLSEHATIDSLANNIINDTHYGLFVRENALVIKARSNQIIGNAMGVQIEGTPRTMDFGSSSEPGKNVFACNSLSSANPGYDVLINFDSAAQTPLALAGNSWDHKPPSSTAGVNGSDLVDTTPGTSAGAITDNATAAGVTCAGGHIQ
jgi:hypothetical protein